MLNQLMLRFRTCCQPFHSSTDLWCRLLTAGFKNFEIALDVDSLFSVVFIMIYIYFSYIFIHKNMCRILSFIFFGNCLTIVDLRLTISSLQDDHYCSQFCVFQQFICSNCSIERNISRIKNSKLVKILPWLKINKNISRGGYFTKD